MRFWIAFGFDFGSSFEAKTAKQKANRKAAREKFEASGLEAVWSEERRARTSWDTLVGGGGGVWLSWIQQLYSVI